MEGIVDFLAKLGLSDTEAKLYLTLLESGPASVRDVAQRIGLKRTTAYLYIENLMKKGLITKNVIDSRSLISPIQPTESLTALIKENEVQAKAMEAQLPNIVSEIKESIQMMKGNDQFKIKNYKGANGVKTVYEEGLQANEFRSYVKMID